MDPVAPGGLPHDAREVPTGQAPARRRCDAWGTRRDSPLLPARTLLHADLHNHTRLSDGRGDPASAFPSLRANGLDVAAITDHVGAAAPARDREPAARGSWRAGGLDEEAWEELGRLAKTADEEGTFVAVRGFEWSDPDLGHVNVWGTSRYHRPAREGPDRLTSLFRWLATGLDDPSEAGVRHDHRGPMSHRHPPVDGLPGDESGVASFNHPGGRGAGRFEDFRYYPEAAEALVGLELFNMTDDYLFQGVDRGRPSPLVACLAAGWRPALLGVTDEHGESWGLPQGKGRTGIWVREWSWQGVRAALRDRLTFATRRPGVRLAVRLNGAPMGSTAQMDDEVLVELDLEPGPEAPPVLGLQLLVGFREGGESRSSDGQASDSRGGRAEKVAASPANWAGQLPWCCDAGTLESAALSAAPLVRRTVPIPTEVGEVAWLVVRLSDPSRPADPRAPREWAGYGETFAYASPVWQAAPAPEPGSQPAPTR